jgi:hypothetical protein
MTSKPPARPVAKGGVRLPPGAYGASVPGTRAQQKAAGAVRPKPVQIDENFVADPRGGNELVVGKRHVEVKDNRTRTER